MAKKSSKKMARAGVIPKLKCCESRSRCRRCPTRMLKEGTLPDGLGVRRRRLVATDTPLVPLTKKQVRVLVTASSTKKSKATKAGKRTGRKAA
ncbi:MAG: hypothetical protein KBB39_02905 [Phycicoccus sp.]|nr:hypothetical protein [Phycicoccus sp.]